MWALYFYAFGSVKEDYPMTKHLYLCSYNNRLAYVLLGWDNNRKGFYMIFDYQNGCEESAIYSNLFSKEPYPKTLNKYISYLTTKNIFLPEEMIHEVIKDSFRRVEDKEVTHMINNGSYTSFEHIDYAIL
jgi:hypothetical protein